MVKTKESEESTDSGNDRDRSDEIIKSTSKCTHINQAIMVAKIKKLVKNGLLSSCPECEREKLAMEDEEGFEYDRSLWLCLKCGVQLCGRRANKHALTHFEVIIENFKNLISKLIKILFFPETA
jgi:uncharacterized UBP type Zn finger protein